jgi:16S rRNA (adenine1518-N6/adenine1519-N6)-dimethyltransferase
VSPARFGQHFLEGPWAAKLVNAISPQGHDIFIEIGPGRAALTRPLAARAAGVVAIEVDPRMIAGLGAEQLPRVVVVPEDVLEVSPERLREELSAFTGGRLRVAGNLPYNIAAPILFTLFDWIDAGLDLDDAVVMVQREVADRLLAAPGSRDYGALGVLVSHRAAMTRMLDLPPGAFRPMPKVRSTVVHLKFHAPSPEVADSDAFPKMIRAVFSRRRKTLANALLAYPPARTVSIPHLLRDAGIDGKRRPETLSLTEMTTLSNALTRTAPPGGAGLPGAVL